MPTDRVVPPRGETEPEERHRLAKLPKWAQAAIAERESAIEELRDELRRLQSAHAVLDSREWFTLPGPTTTPDEVVKLWFLSRNEPVLLCSLFRGDVLLIGRAALRAGAAPAEEEEPRE